MRIQITDSSVKLWVSHAETYDWARRPGATWPNSYLAGQRFFAEFDANGLVDLTVNGKYGVDAPADEFNAITSDFLRGQLPEDHPAYFVAVGQFLQ